MGVSEVNYFRLEIALMNTHFFIRRIYLINFQMASYYIKKISKMNIYSEGPITPFPP